MAAFYVVTVAISMSHIHDWLGFGMYLIYLTDWGILLCMFTGLYGAILVSVWHFHPEYSGELIDVRLRGSAEHILYIVSSNR